MVIKIKERILIELWY